MCTWSGKVLRNIFGVMEKHHLFPFVEQSLGQSVLCRRAQQRWSLLTLSRGQDCGTWEADVLCCSLFLQLSVPAFSGYSHWPQVFLSHILLPSQPLLQQVTPPCFSSTVAFLSTLHNHHIGFSLWLRRQGENLSTFTPAIHFTSVCLQKMSLFCTHPCLSQNEMGCNLGIA